MNESMNGAIDNEMNEWINWNINISKKNESMTQQINRPKHNKLVNE